MEENELKELMEVEKTPFRVGDKVRRLKPCSKGLLHINNIYEISKIKQHNKHIWFYLKGFNKSIWISSKFEKVDEIKYQEISRKNYRNVTIIKYVGEKENEHTK